MIRVRRSKKLPVVLSVDEVRRILRIIERPRYLACLSTIYTCGLRLSKGVYLQVGDIDSDRMMVHVRHRKGAQDRYVPLPVPTLEMLRRYCRTHRHRKWLFPGRTKSGVQPSAAAKPMPIGGVQRAFKAALHDSGFRQKATVHTLRHSYGRPFGRLVNALLNATRHQGRVSLPRRLRDPSIPGLVSFRGT